MRIGEENGTIQNDSTEGSGDSDLMPPESRRPYNCRRVGVRTSESNCRQLLVDTTHGRTGPYVYELIYFSQVLRTFSKMSLGMFENNFSSLLTVLLYLIVTRKNDLGYSSWKQSINKDVETVRSSGKTSRETSGTIELSTGLSSCLRVTRPLTRGGRRGSEPKTCQQIQLYSIYRSRSFLTYLPTPCKEQEISGQGFTCFGSGRM